MFEVMRMCELPNIYSQCYDKPFQLPYKVQEVLRGSKQGDDHGSKSEVHLEGNYEKRLLHADKNFAQKTLYP